MHSSPSFVGAAACHLQGHSQVTAQDFSVTPTWRAPTFGVQVRTPGRFTMKEVLEFTRRKTAAVTSDIQAQEKASSALRARTLERLFEEESASDREP